MTIDKLHCAAKVSRVDCRVDLDPQSVRWISTHILTLLLMSLSLHSRCCCFEAEIVVTLLRSWGEI